MSRVLKDLNSSEEVPEGVLMKERGLADRSLDPVKRDEA